MPQGADPDLTGEIDCKGLKDEATCHLGKNARWCKFDKVKNECEKMKICIQYSTSAECPADRGHW